MDHYWLIDQMQQCGWIGGKGARRIIVTHFHASTP